MKRATLTALVLASWPFLSPASGIVAQAADRLPLSGAYFGQRPPGARPEAFASSITSGRLRSGGFAFARGGTEVFFYSIDARGRYALHYSELSDSGWTAPRGVFLSDSGNSAHPFFSPDGNTVYFGSDRRIRRDTRVPYYNIWFSERRGETWGAPRPASATINTGYENCGSFGEDSMLFFRRVSSRTRGDIFASRLVNGEFTTPVPLPGGVNTAWDESHPAIAPDGSYLVFSSKRPGGFSQGRDELWVSFRDANGDWGAAVNLGPEINDGRNVSSATISPDGRYLFFVRIEGDIGVGYWVSATVIERLRPGEYLPRPPA